jgi:two-component system nitrogen regulation response regulator GlnG
MRLLVQHYLLRCNRELGREIREIAPEAFECLTSYHWPGNIRELQSVLKQALLQAHGTTLLPAHLPAFGPERSGSGPPAVSSQADPSLEAFIAECLAANEGDQYAEAHRRLDLLFLTRAMEAAGWSQHEAARRLGIARQTLRRRLQELGLHVTRRLEMEEEEAS